MNDVKKKAFRQGWIVFIALLVLTAIEFFVGISQFNSVTLLFIISLLKAALIVYFFMHIYRLWREESH